MKHDDREMPDVKPSGMARQIERLAALISDMHEEWSLLERKLRPVLQNVEAPVEDLQDRPGAGTPLAEEIAQQADRLWTLRRDIQSAREQLDL